MLASMHEYGIRIFAEYETSPLWTRGPRSDPHPSIER
jgi:hypothetical protein